MCTCQRPPNDKNFSFGFFNKTTLTGASKNPQLFFSVFFLYSQKSKKQSQTLAKIQITQHLINGILLFCGFFPGFKPV